MRRLRRLPWQIRVLVPVLVVVGAWTRPIAAAGVAGAVAVLLAVVVLVRRAGPVVIDDWQVAEHTVARWLETAGCRDVRLTGAGRDGGIDVVSREWAVQVKHQARPVGRPTIQQIVGAALGAGRRPAVASTSGFTDPAFEFAVEHDVALVVVDLDGTVLRVNRHARDIGRRSSRRRFVPFPRR